MILKIYQTTPQEVDSHTASLQELPFVQLKEAPPAKLASFLASRKALLLALQEAGIETSLSELKILNYSYLEICPHLCLSLSHSQNIGAALVAPRSEVKSVGVDIELWERKVPEGSQKHFLHPDDDRSLPLLNLWSLKEAAFKAFDPVKAEYAWRDSLFLKDLWIKQTGPQKVLWGHEEGPLGEASWEIYPHSSQEYLVTQAFLKQT